MLLLKKCKMFQNNFYTEIYTPMQYHRVLAIVEYFDTKSFLWDNAIIVRI